MRATSLSNPIPAMAEVGDNISCMPGPPFGPSYRTITMCPGFTFPPIIPAMASGSDSNMMAFPSLTIISGATADCFTTAPPGARFPRRMASPPSL